MTKYLDRLSWPVFRNMAILFIIVSVLGLYYPSLWNDFAHDDDGQIVGNPYVQDIRYLSKAFTSTIWEAQLGPAKGINDYYRPLQALSYLFTYAASSAPGFFHLVNLVYYILLSYVFFLLLTRLFRNRCVILALLALFVFHPIHTESVAWIASVPELLYSLFAVLAITAYLSDWQYKRRWISGLFFAGLLSKEPALFIPAVFMVYDFVWEKNRIDRRYLLGYWPYAAVFSVYIAMRVWVIGGLASASGGFYRFAPAERFYSTIFIFGEYIRKMFWPVELNPFIPFEKIQAASDPRLWTPALLTIAFVAVFIQALYRRQKLVIFGLSVYLLFLSPVILAINSLGENVISERYLLLPSAGMLIVVGYLLVRLFEDKRRFIQILSRVALIVLLVISAPRVYAQNFIWKSSKVLYEHIHELNTMHGYPSDVTYYNLAVIYEREGRIEDARKAYEAVVSDRYKIPTVYKAYNNLGKIYTQEGRIDEAIAMFQRSIEYNPRHKSAFNNMGIAYMERGEYVKALESYIKAIQIDQGYIEAEHNLSILYSRVIELLPAEETQGPRRDLDSFLMDMLKSDVWRGWEYLQVEQERGDLYRAPVIDAMRLDSVEKQPDGAMEVKITINPGLMLALSPQMIFYTLDDGIHLIPDFFKKYDRDASEISLLVGADALISPAEEEEIGDRKDSGPFDLYVVLNDFRYYRFEIE